MFKLRVLLPLILALAACAPPPPDDASAELRHPRDAGGGDQGTVKPPPQAWPFEIELSPQSLMREFFVAGDVVRLRSGSPDMVVWTISLEPYETDTGTAITYGNPTHAFAHVLSTEGWHVYKMTALTRSAAE
jgi:hypothetical protein